jgi:hypothetical protein
MTIEIKKTFSELRKILRENKDKSWLFTQNTEGQTNFEKDAEVAGRYWNGVWVGKPMDTDFIAHWVADDLKLYVGKRSTEPQMPVLRTVNKNGKPIRCYKIPMDEVLIYLLRANQGEPASFAGLLRPERASVGNLYSYWPKSSTAFKADGLKPRDANERPKSISTFETPQFAGITKADFENIENAINLLQISNPLRNEVLREVWCRTSAHGIYRKALLNYWQGRCSFTGHKKESLLVASHIKPWSKSSPSEQTNIHNGLLLLSPIDKLFDRGYLSFDDDGEVLLHVEPLHDRYLSDKELAAFGLSRNSPRKLRKTLNEEQKNFMRYHRDEVFGR